MVTAQLISVFGVLHFQKDDFKWHITLQLECRYEINWINWKLEIFKKFLTINQSDKQDYSSLTSVIQSFLDRDFSENLLIYYGGERKMKPFQCFC